MLYKRTRQGTVTDFLKGPRRIWLLSSVVDWTRLDAEAAWCPLGSLLPFLPTNNSTFTPRLLTYPMMFNLRLCCIRWHPIHGSGSKAAGQKGRDRHARLSPRQAGPHGTVHVLHLSRLRRDPQVYKSWWAMSSLVWAATSGQQYMVLIVMVAWAGLQCITRARYMYGVLRTPYVHTGCGECGLCNDELSRIPAKDQATTMRENAALLSRGGRWCPFRSGAQVSSSPPTAQLINSSATECHLRSTCGVLLPMPRKMASRDSRSRL